jgi:hypothetical protein
MDFTFTQFCGKINAADNLLIFKNDQIANVTDKEVKDVPTMHTRVNGGSSHDSL